MNREEADELLEKIRPFIQNPHTGLTMLDSASVERIVNSFINKPPRDGVRVGCTFKSGNGSVVLDYDQESKMAYLELPIRAKEESPFFNLSQLKALKDAVDMMFAYMNGDEDGN